MTSPFLRSLNVLHHMDEKHNKNHVLDHFTIKIKFKTGLNKAPD